MESFASNCNPKFKAYHTSGKRHVADIKWIVMHDEESPSAKAAARYFTDPQSGGSAHICVDDNECYRCVPDDEIAWGAPGANEHGWHIEQAGYAKWSAVIWKKHHNTLSRAAYKAAFHCKKFDIPVVFLTCKELEIGRKGITTHAECTKAFGGSHTDPGLFWPRRYFMALVRKHYKAL